MAFSSTVKVIVFVRTKIIDSRSYGSPATHEIGHDGVVNVEVSLSDPNIGFDPAIGHSILQLYIAFQDSMQMPVL
jgi:predicted transport protein